MTETAWKTTELESLEYGMYAGIPDIAPVLYQSGVRVRQNGNVYQYFCNRMIDLNGSLGEVITKLATETSDMQEVAITTRFGGGMGHYGYAVISRVTGWVTMTPEQVKAFKTLKHNVTSMRKAEREIKRLRKMADQMETAKRKGLF